MICVLLLVLAAGCQPISNRDVLWSIVHGQCVPHAQDVPPSPCLAVDTKGGYALLKDRTGATQILLIPTSRVTGIEDPAILAPSAPNYFAEAWQALPRVNALAGGRLAPADLSLAINAETGRTQDQLHIHLDCLTEDTKATLAAHSAAIGPMWARFPVPLGGRDNWSAVHTATLDDRENPFHLLADGLLPVSGASMGQSTLVVTAAPDGGFFVLAGRADVLRGDRGDGERLQDHDCALARQI